MFEWKSEAIDQIAAALCEAQKVMQPAVKDRNNPAFKSKYADLAAVWEAMGEGLQANGLALVQLPFPADGGFILRTVLMHKSGQWILSDLFMAPDMNNAQKVGGAITYARRYSASAMVGVYQDDDDGNTAVNGHGGYGYQNGNARTPAPASPKPHPAEKPAPAADNRPYPEYVKAAADKCLASPMALHRHIMDEAIGANYLGDGLRDNDAIVSDLSDLYMHRREWVRGVVKEYVKSHAGNPAAA